MLERLNPIFRLVCIALAGLIVYQLARLVAKKDPLRDLQFASSAVAANPGKPTARSEKESELPPPIKAQVDKITQSEILGAVAKPLPMALLGIAGRDAFVRTANGQTVLMREGDEVGGLKLLRIGTNRILVEHEQQEKELTLFSGFGGETLIQKDKTK